MTKIQKMQSEGFRQHILKVVLNEHTDISMLCSEFQGRLRPVVPPKMQRDIFQKTHNIDHSRKKKNTEENRYALCLVRYES